MYFPQKLSTQINKSYALDSLGSIIFISIILTLYNYLRNLFEIGHYAKTNFQWILLAFQLIKSVITSTYMPSAMRGRRFKIQNVFKSFYTFFGAIAVIHSIAVLFGAPFLSKQQETFTFALTLTTLTMVPTIFHLGHEMSIYLFLSIVSMNFSEHLIQMQFTCLGAWLGAAIIPLDWDRDYQIWPVPCILGSLWGYLMGNLVLIVLFLLQLRGDKRNLKQNC